MKVESVLILSCGMMCAALPVARAGLVSGLPEEVDVVVAGGTAAGVVVAEEAKRAGASVCVLAPRTFLGEDIAATYRLMREDESDDPVFAAIFSRDHLPLEPCPYTYAYAKDGEPDSEDGGRLKDDLCGNPGRDGIPFSGDAVVVADLGAETEIRQVEVSAFRRVRPEAKWRPVPKDPYHTKSVTVVTSSDGKTWRNRQVARGRNEGNSVATHVAVFETPVRCRYVKFRAKLDETYPRQMLGELRIRRPDAGRERFAPYTMPLKVKRTLDKVLAAADIPVLTGAPVCDVLKDEKGRFAGVVYAGRDGVKTIRAKVLVDATERGWTAACAGGRAQPFAAEKTVFRRMVFAPDAPVAEGLLAHDRGVGAHVTVREKAGGARSADVRFWLCEKEVTPKDASPLSLAEADAQMRDATFTYAQVDAGDTSWFTPADAFLPAGDGGDLADYRPDGTANVFVTGPRAAIAREKVEAARALGAQLALGRRVGRAAAAAAKSAPKPGPANPASGELPVYGEFDVVVAGGGTGGAPAGIAAARQGVRTAVCEFMAVLGGQSTEGRISGYYFGNICGFTKEIDREANDFGAIKVQGKAEWYRREIRKAGGTVLLTTLVAGVVRDGGRLTGVEVVFPDGRRGILRCRTAVDATGNADLAAAAGEETEFITGEELAVQGAGVTRRIPGQAGSNNDIGFVDETSAADIAFFSRRARLTAPEETWDLSQIVGSRERRRMRGVFFMTPQDVMAERRYPDVIARTRSNFDTHGQTMDRQFFIEDPVHTPMYVNLPYRCLLPKRTDGLLVIGLGMSAHRDAMPILRMVPDIQNQGYAAGVAAAMSVKADVPPRAIDVKALQRHLVEKSVIPSEALDWTDTLPYPDSAFDEAVRTLPNGYQGLNTLLTDTARAVPRLKAAFAAATDEEAKFAYAHVLALLGQGDGTSLLIARLEKAESWDKGWNYKGMSQFNRSVSWMDSYVIALGSARAKDAVPVICELAARLDADSEYSHFRAVSKALESIGDVRGASVLSACLKKPGVGGHARTVRTLGPLPALDNNVANRERSLALREICLARALYRLGDDADRLGHRTLEAYAADPRGAFAAHARLVLSASL